MTQDEGEEDSTPTLPSGTDENPIPGSWQLSGGEYYLVDDSGRMLTGWQKYDTAWYYMDESGVMQTGWLQLGDTWYYLYDWGGMATGWYKVGNTWYYADSSGKMLSGQWLELGRHLVLFEPVRLNGDRLAPALRQVVLPRFQRRDGDRLAGNRRRDLLYVHPDRRLRHRLESDSTT